MFGEGNANRYTRQAVADLGLIDQSSPELRAEAEKKKKKDDPITGAASQLGLPTAAFSTFGQFATRRNAFLGGLNW